MLTFSHINMGREGSQPVSNTRVV